MFPTPKYMAARDVANLIIEESADIGAPVNAPKLLHLLYAVQGFSMAVHNRPAFRDSIMGNVGPILVWIDDLMPVLRNTHHTKPIMNPIPVTSTGFAGYEHDAFWSEIARRNADIAFYLQKIRATATPSSHIDLDTHKLVKKVVRRYSRLNSEETNTSIDNNNHSALAKATARDGQSAIVCLKDMREEFNAIIVQTTSTTNRDTVTNAPSK